LLLFFKATKTICTLISKIEAKFMWGGVVRKEKWLGSVRTEKITRKSKLENLKSLTPVNANDRNLEQ